MAISNDLGLACSGFAGRVRGEYRRHGLASEAHWRFAPRHQLRVLRHRAERDNFGVGPRAAPSMPVTGGGLRPNPQMQPTNAGGPALRLGSTLPEAIRTIGCDRSFAADLHVVRPQHHHRAWERKCAHTFY